MEASGQLHAPTTIPTVKNPPVPIGRGNGWTSEPVRTRWGREKNPCPCWETNPAIQPVA